MGADESTGLVKQSMAKYHLRLPQGAPKQRPFASATAIRCRQSSLSGRPRPLDTNEYLCVYKSYKRKRERGRIRVAWLAMQYIINEMLCLLLVLFPFRFVVGRADLCKYKRTLLL